MKVVLAAFVLVVTTASVAQAQSFFETWVASSGNDANNCYRTTPCATFGRAFSQTVGGGVIRVLDSGPYSAFTITRSVTIDFGGIATTLNGVGVQIGPQITVSAGTSDVVIIRNLVLSGMRLGSVAAIKATSVGALHIENCTFTAFGSRAVDFQATSGYLQMKNVTIADQASGTGIYVANSRASLENVSVHNTQTAVIAAGSSSVSVTHSTFNGNGTALAAAYGPTAQINIDDCLMSNNQWAVVVGQGASAYVGRSSFFNNYIQALYRDGSSFLVSYGTNQFAGNASDGSFTSGLAVK